MQTIDALTRQLAESLLGQGLMLATAESCTGGLIAKTCTDLAGSSEWFERGFVTYSNQAKVDMLGVALADLQTHGAVSEPVARQMAAGALARSRAQVAVGVTGIAGPGGGSIDKPVGTVWFGFASTREVTSECLLFAGDRQQVRQQSLEHALRRLVAMLG